MMIVYISNVSNDVIGVSSNWSTAVKRIMEQYPQYTEYGKKLPLGPNAWSIVLPDQTLGGIISAVEMDKRMFS